MFQILHCEAQNARHFWRVLLCFGSEAFGAASRAGTRGASPLHGPWSMVHGSLTMVHMDHGSWTIVHGPWTLDGGSWLMVHAPWSMDHGSWMLCEVFHWKAQNARKFFGVWFGALQWRLCCSELRGFKRGFAPLERLNTHRGISVCRNPTGSASDRVSCQMTRLEEGGMLMFL